MNKYPVDFTTEYRVTKEDITDLRKADRICFDWFEGVHKIRAIKTGRKNQSETTTTVLCAGSVEIGWQSDDFSPVNAYEMIHHAQMLEWQTIAKTLKAGDVIKLCWYAGNNSEVIKDAGLVCDMLRLRIDRETKNGVKQFMFHIRTQTGKNNTARMIRGKENLWY